MPPKWVSWPPPPPLQGYLCKLRAVQFNVRYSHADKQTAGKALRALATSPKKKTRQVRGLPTGRQAGKYSECGGVAASDPRGWLVGWLIGQLLDPLCLCPTPPPPAPAGGL